MQDVHYQRRQFATPERHHLAMNEKSALRVFFHNDVVVVDTGICTWRRTKLVFSDHVVVDVQRNL